jgi:hypothetical protein
VGLVLAAHALQISRVVFLGALGRLTVQNVVLLALLHLLHVQSPFARESLICCSFPLSTVVVLFAARYKSSESETASMLYCPHFLWQSQFRSSSGLRIIGQFEQLPQNQYQE